ncbi:MULTISPECIES: hypothetical protein [unclassified Helicobacter]|uniref:hypothetical protein n=1 Tax=unclassified Helicobacter TaxID=2593540 RepID=UPI00115F8F7C|nr:MULTISPECIES: hypothetical protein [unclassified Helicobacter]
MSKLKVVLGGVALGALGYGVKKLIDNLDKKIADKDNLYFDYADAIKGETLKGATKLFNSGARGVGNIYEDIFDEPYYSGEYWDKGSVELECKAYESALGDLSPNLTKELKYSLARLGNLQEESIRYALAGCDKEEAESTQAIEKLEAYIAHIRALKDAINAYEMACLATYRNSIAPLQGLLGDMMRSSEMDADEVDSGASFGEVDSSANAGGADSRAMRAMRAKIEGRANAYASDDNATLRANIARKYEHIDIGDAESICATLQEVAENLPNAESGALMLAESIALKEEAEFVDSDALDAAIKSLDAGAESSASDDTAGLAQLYDAMACVLEADIGALQSLDERLQASLALIKEAKS